MPALTKAHVPTIDEIAECFETPRATRAIGMERRRRHDARRNQPGWAPNYLPVPPAIARYVEHGRDLGELERCIAQADRNMHEHYRTVVFGLRRVVDDLGARSASPGKSFTLTGADGQPWVAGRVHLELVLSDGSDVRAFVHFATTAFSPRRRSAVGAIVSRHIEELALLAPPRLLLVDARAARSYVVTSEVIETLPAVVDVSRRFRDAWG